MRRQSVGRGQTLAIIESREAAQLQGEVEASRARLALASSNLAREERLFAQRVSPEQDVIAARTAATEARIAYRLAQQQVSAAGGGGGQLNRIAIAAPISVMRFEHDQHGEALAVLNDLTNDITLPKGACNTWRALYGGLAQLRDDLMQHIHLENNILFADAQDILTA